MEAERQKSWSEGVLYGGHQADRWQVTSLHGVEGMPAGLILSLAKCSFPEKDSLAYLEGRLSPSLFQFHPLL